jgi:molecular chaperone DnaK
VQEAAQNVEADQARRALVELRNKADGLIYSTERTLEEFAKNVKPQDRSAIDTMIEKAREAMKNDDAAALRTAVDELSALAYQMTETLYAEFGGKETCPDPTFGSE